ncbi:MAG: sodium:calcium antiporter [Clostridia bacterium]|nr:sodium:calcium antiporter [Clostridia bacterium]
MLIIETIGLCVLVMVFCLFFVNAVEALAEQIGLSQTAAGSVLASLGTATPETLVPVIAILFGGSGGHGHDIGVGAILGAPFMLTTIALGVVGLTAVTQVIIGNRKTPYLDLEPGILRNFKFFFVFYPLAIIAALIGSRPLNYALGVFLLLGYAYFVYITFKTPGEEAGGEVAAASEGAEEEEEHADLWLNKIFRFKEPPVWLSVVQLVGGFVLMAYTIKVFADMLGTLSEVYGIPAAVLSLVVAPLATELPEVGGASVFWTARHKDTLALGNITGAMVYQSSIAVCLGLFLTDWKLTGDVAASIVVALLSGGIIFGYYLMKKRLSAWVVFTGCFFYIAYLFYIFSSGIGGV